MKQGLPALLSFNGGYVDTAGFLALQGLFTAHVTGNFVTFGASLVLGTSGASAKLLALPVFCVVVVLSRFLCAALERRGAPILRVLLALKTLLLAAGGALAIRLGPFHDGDAWPAILTGMVLVTAMALQNGMHRAHMSTTPPTTLMTGTTTQIMIDLADLMRGVPAEAKAAAKGRLGKMSASVAAFALGCAAAAGLFLVVREWAFVVPPAVAFIGFLIVGNEPAKV
ncbi:DUF1275 family protein [Nitrospirillum iridis]|uniref:Uncharacterized membrane protein YoaK (UPF0700 family) n=1 Tax=Nitrospirillum iridis TaxID=765888 RepID=A0A7X0B0R5_9PROT|nr:DUF1275 family protein [Nitrospirillum iridis]MBB6253657.1 uncharacterized membrane protein YoaK (UPF0700 family) [Nitrospirillum iridis]